MANTLELATGLQTSNESANNRICRLSRRFRVLYDDEYLTDRDKNCKRWWLLLFLGGTWVCASCHVVARELLHEDGGDGQIHLSFTSRGICYCVYLACMLDPIIRLCFKKQDVPMDLKQKLVEDMTDSKLNKIFYEDLSLGDKAFRFARCLFKIARAIFNTCMIGARFFDLGPIILKKPLSRAKHVVAWYEVIAIWDLVSIVATSIRITCFPGYRLLDYSFRLAWLGSLVCFLVNRTSEQFHIFFIIFLFWFFGIKRRGQSTNHWADVSVMIDESARFSVLNCLHHASIGVLVTQFKREQWFGRMRFLLIVFNIVSYLFVGFWALAVKIEQVDFVGHTKYWSWSFLQWCQLFSLINNIVGIVDLASAYQVGIFEKWRKDKDREFKDYTAQMILDNWMRSFGDEVARIRGGPRCGGPGAVYICLTLTPKDIAKVVSLKSLEDAEAQIHAEADARKSAEEKAKAAEEKAAKAEQAKKDAEEALKDAEAKIQAEADARKSAEEKAKAAEEKADRLARELYGLPPANFMSST